MGLHSYCSFICPEMNEVVCGMLLLNFICLFIFWKMQLYMLCLLVKNLLDHGICFSKKLRYPYSASFLLCFSSALCGWVCIYMLVPSFVPMQDKLIVDLLLWISSIQGFKDRVAFELTALHVCFCGFRVSFMVLLSACVCFFFVFFYFVYNIL